MFHVYLIRLKRKLLLNLKLNKRILIFTELYKINPVDLEIQQSFLDNLDENLTPEQTKLCDEPLLHDEISNALFTLAKNKTPGTDGLPKEFYVKFWDLLAPILLDLFNFSFEKGSFSSSMQQSITRLLYKKDVKRDLKNCDRSLC